MISVQLERDQGNEDIQYFWNVFLLTFQFQIFRAHDREYIEAILTEVAEMSQVHPGVWKRLIDPTVRFMFKDVP